MPYHDTKHIHLNLISKYNKRKIILAHILYNKVLKEGILYTNNLCIITLLDANYTLTITFKNPNFTPI